MNQAVASDFDALSRGPGRFHRTAIEALPHLGDLGASKIPVGLANLWGHDLGWPDWLLEGTSLRPPLGERIDLADDVMLYANLMDHIGRPALIRAMLQDHYQPFSPEFLPFYSAAPNKKILLHTIFEIIRWQNPHLLVDFTETMGTYSIRISTPKPLGIVGEGLEHCVAALLLRTSRLLQTHLASYSSQMRNWPRIALNNADDDTIGQLTAFGNVDVHSHDEATCLTFNRKVGEMPNPRYSAGNWGKIVRRLEMLRSRDLQIPSVHELRARISESLATRHRTPSLAEIANEAGVSERTLSRTFAAQGINFNDVVSQTRSELALTLLRDDHYTMAEISELLGYSNGASFGRAFRKEFGMPPGQWRVNFHENRDHGPS